MVDAYHWVDTDPQVRVPGTAVKGGVEIDGSEIFVGRAYHEGNWIPANVIPEKSVAYVAWNGEEIAVNRFQVLCQQRFVWGYSSTGNIPSDAVVGGKTSDGENLYIGRVQLEDALVIGKVHPSHGVCYYPFNGKEEATSDYEILIPRP